MAGEEENIELHGNNQTESQSNNEVVIENGTENPDSSFENVDSVIPDISQSEKQNETTNQTEEPVDDANEKLRQETSPHERLIKLPLSRIKVIMKSDPDVTLASQEAVITLTKATELFIAMLSKDAVISTLNSKRKTLQRKDLDNVLDTRDGYAFLEGTLD